VAAVKAESRREALRIIGAVGSTCAFPFGADQLYGQQAGHAPGGRFFDAAQMETLAKLTDLIIPPTETAGAARSGVPEYIDRVVSVEKEHQIVFRDGLAWLDRQATSAHGKVFRDLDEEQQIAMLTPLCEAADSNQLKKPGARFFRSLKSMTADGYYTSRTGLVDELGYKGNMAMAGFPSCEVKEH
jgi:hypothetical protein